MGTRPLVDTYSGLTAATLCVFISKFTCSINGRDSEHTQLHIKTVLRFDFVGGIVTGVVSMV